MNKIEEFERRCKQLEDRVEALEKAFVSHLGVPQKAVVIEKDRLTKGWNVGPGIIQPRRRMEPDSEMFMVHPDKVTWHGGQ